MENVAALLKPEDLYIKFKVQKKSGRAWIITPDGSEPVFEKAKVDNTILMALARACLWRRELRRGKYESIRDLAARNKIDESYARRVLNLNYLSPKMKEIIVDGKLPKYLKLQDIIYDAPISWKEQEIKWLRLL